MMLTQGPFGDAEGQGKACYGVTRRSGLRSVRPLSRARLIVRSGVGCLEPCGILSQGDERWSVC